MFVIMMILAKVLTQNTIMKEESYTKIILFHQIKVH